VLHVHRAERADGLVDALRALLADPLPDPFAHEVISVPTRGMERWLTQRMSSGLGASPGRADGVCANVDFPTPRRLVGDAVAAASGVEPADDAWLPERSVWPLLELVGDRFGEHRFTAARHLAELFDRYALHRPELLAAWCAGEDGGVPADAAWQAELWRRLRQRIGAPGPAERLDGACARLRAEPGLLDLPERLALFGLTRIAAGHLAVLRALAARRDVHLFVLHPSPALWEAVARAPRVVRRTDDVTQTLPRNRLLASWGHDVREMQATRTTSTTTIPSSRAPTRCWDASRRACARTPSRRSTPPTPACRSTRATAAPGRSRCCGTRSSTCSRTIRRSSRAT
jgi:exodeoxyribonuclease V gamma subunit